MTNFSWQMGQTVLVLSPSSGTGMYWIFGPDDLAAEEAAALLAASASASAWLSSTVSRDFIQSWRSRVSHVRRSSKGRGWDILKYLPPGQRTNYDAGLSSLLRRSFGEPGSASPCELFSSFFLPRLS